MTTKVISCYHTHMQFLSEKLLVIWLKLGMYALPFTLFLYLQRTISPFISLKLYVFQIVAVLIFAIWLTLIIKYPSYRPARNKLAIVAAVFIGLLILSAIFGFNISRSLWSSSDRGIGVIALLHFSVLTLVFAVGRPIVDWKKYLEYLFWISVGMSFFVILQRLAPTLFYVANGERPGGTLGNPQYLTGYLITNIFLGLWLISRNVASVGKRYSFVVGEAVLAVSFVLANTRGAIIGLVIGAVVLLIYSAWRKLLPFDIRKSVYRNWALIFLILLTVIGCVFLLTKGNTFWQKVPLFNRLAQTSLQDASTGNRIIVWKIAKDSILERPILGWGWDNFRYPFNKHYEPSLFTTGGSETYWDKPHNVFMEMGVSLGVVGLIVYIYLLYLMTRRLSRPDKFGVYGVAMMAAYVAQNMVSFDTFGSFFMFFALLGVAIYDIKSGVPVNGEQSRSYNLAPVIVSVIVGLSIVFASVFVSTQIFRANRANYNGLNYFVQSRAPEALAYFKQALAINQPYQNEIRESYISSLKQLVSQTSIPDTVIVLQSAVAEMEKAILSDPNNFFYYYSLADAKNVYSKFDKSLLDGAVEDIKKSEELSPRRQQNYYVKSRTALIMGDKSGAIDAMKMAVEVAPNVAEPHFYYALLLMDDAKYLQGLKELLEAARLGRYPKNGAEARAVHTYLERSGWYIDEIDYFNDALDHAQLNEETSLEYRYQLGKAYHRADSLSNAKLVFGEVLILYPQFREDPRFKDEFAKIFRDIGL